MNLRQYLLVTPHSKLQCRHTHRSAAMFAESYRLLRVNQAKELVVVYQWRIYAKWRPWQNFNVHPF